VSHQNRPERRPNSLAIAFVTIALSAALVATGLGILAGRPNGHPNRLRPETAATAAQPESTFFPPFIAGTVPPDLHTGMVSPDRPGSARIGFLAEGRHYFSLSWGGESTLELVVTDGAGKEVARASSSAGSLDLEATGAGGIWNVQVRPLEARGPIAWGVLESEQPVSLRSGRP
jgi:hypothetical protein